MKPKKEFEHDENGWVYEVGEPKYVEREEKPKIRRKRGRPKNENNCSVYVKTRLNAEDKKILEMLEIKRGKSTSCVIRELIREAASEIRED